MQKTDLNRRNERNEQVQEDRFSSSSLLQCFMRDSLNKKDVDSNKEKLK